MPHDEGLTYGSPIVTKLCAELPADGDGYALAAAVGDVVGELQIEHREAIETAAASLRGQIADLKDTIAADRERIARLEGMLMVLTSPPGETQSKRAAPRTRSRQSVSSSQSGNVVKFS